MALPSGEVRTECAVNSHTVKTVGKKIKNFTRLISHTVNHTVLPELSGNECP